MEPRLRPTLRSAALLGCWGCFVPSRSGPSAGGLAVHDGRKLPCNQYPRVADAGGCDPVMVLGGMAMATASPGLVHRGDPGDRDLFGCAP